MLVNRRSKSIVRVDVVNYMKRLRPWGSFTRPNIHRISSLHLEESMNNEELARWFEQNKKVLETAYLAGTLPWQQSGFGLHTPRSELDWEALRRPIAACIESAGTFLDIGCANGYLLVHPTLDARTRLPDDLLWTRFLGEDHCAGSSAASAVCFPPVCWQCMGLGAAHDLRLCQYDARLCPPRTA